MKNKTCSHLHARKQLHARPSPSLYLLTLMTSWILLYAETCVLVWRMGKMYLIGFKSVRVCMDWASWGKNLRLCVCLNCNVQVCKCCVYASWSHAWVCASMRCRIFDLVSDASDPASDLGYICVDVCLFTWANRDLAKQNSHFWWGLILSFVWA